MTDRDSSLSLANVNIYTVGREWIASAVSGSDGRFTISGVCVAGLKLTARKGGYESVLQEYSVTSGSSVNVVMMKLGRPTSVETSEFSSCRYVCELFSIYDEHTCNAPNEIYNSLIIPIRFIQYCV